MISDFQRIATFITVVEAGSFSAAARSLGITKSAVSRQISLLESRHNVKLLHRSTRRLRMTEAGETLYKDCVPILEAARGALSTLETHQETPTGILRISSPIGLGEHFVAPALAVFLEMYPALRAEIQLEDSVIDLLAEGIDLAIRGGRFENSSLISRKIAPLPMVLCASPHYISRYGMPKKPEELLKHSWIEYRLSGTSPQRLVFLQGRQKHIFSIKGKVVTNNGTVLRQLLRQGLGLGILPTFFVKEDIKAGRLQAILTSYQIPIGHIMAVYPSGGLLPSKVRFFVDFLIKTSTQKTI